MLETLQQLAEVERERFLLFLELLRLVWPIIAKALGLLISVGLAVFVSMVVEECSEDTVR